MRKGLRVLGALLSAVLLLAGAGWLAARKPAQRPPPMPRRMARGKDLVEHVSKCMHCHSQLQFSVSGAAARAGHGGARRRRRLRREGERPGRSRRA